MPFKKLPEPVPPGHKWCFKCGTAQPVQRFYKDRRNADGRQYDCRRCYDVRTRCAAETRRTGIRLSRLG